MVEIMAEWQQQMQQQHSGDIAHESLGNDLFVSKRQRRPSVRLGEIGDQPAAVLAEPNLKRKRQLKIGQEDSGVFPYSPKQAAQSHSGANSDGNDAVESALVPIMVTKTRPLLYGTDGIIHQQKSAIFGDERQCRDMFVDPMCSHLALRQQGQASQFNCSAEIGGRRILTSSKFSSKSSRNRKRRRGGLKGHPAIEQLRRVVPSMIEIGNNENERTSDTADPPSEHVYDSDTRQGFREYNLQASGPIRDLKETSKSLDGHGVNRTIVSKSVLIHENAYESSRQAGIEDECIPDQEDKDGEDREGSANIHVSPMVGSQREDKRISSKPSLGMMRPSSENKRCLEDPIPQSDTENKQVERLQSKVRQFVSLVDGVNGWLSSLGLGKYAPVFEAHEVDTEVLPFLTLEDLKEMGISAVGTRRKIFCAIQGLRKRLDPL